MQRIVIILLDPKGILSSNNYNSLKRQNIYADELAKHNNSIFNFELHIFTRSDVDLSSINTKTLFIHSVRSKKFGLIGFCRKVKATIMEDNLDVRLMIAGDPWLPAMSGKILQLILKHGEKTTHLQDVQLQIQIHADIFHKRWKYSTLINWIKFQVSVITLNFADGIRVVNEQSYEYLRYKFRSKKLRIVESPVPLNLDLDSIENRVEPRRETIAFVGRVHLDRGIKDFVRIAEIILNAHSKTQVLIVGGGKHLAKLEKSLDRKSWRHNVQLVGELDKTAIKGIWNNIGVLISTAPQESYGRTLREALSMQVPVLVTESTGALNLKKIAEDSMYSIVDAQAKESVILSEFLRIKNSVPKTNFYKIQIGIDQKSVTDLIDSWLDLVFQRKIS
jgi:glycosyltransferase involved in cell wall biosynthesis